MLTAILYMIMVRWCTEKSVKRHGALTGNILVHNDDGSSICWGDITSVWRKLGRVVDRK